MSREILNQEINRLIVAHEDGTLPDHIFEWYMQDTDRILEAIDWTKREAVKPIMDTVATGTGMSEQDRDAEAQNVIDILDSL